MMDLFDDISVDNEIQNALLDTQEDFVSLQKDQLKAGLTSEDENITRLSTGSDEYSPGYATYKGRKKPIDLHDKGEFYADIFTDVREDIIVIDSADSKSGMLQETYGENIFGLEEKRSGKFNDIVGPHLVLRVETKLE